MTDKKVKYINRDCIDKIKNLSSNRLIIHNRLFECEKEINKRVCEVTDNPFFYDIKYEYNDFNSCIQIKIYSDGFDTEMIDSLNEFFESKGNITVIENKLVLIYEVC